ncbi:MAG: hypothetical protein JWN66_2241 [Sphingomonas bacterium]|nr:hypothetical protein [Sphingomonas bacterium]
MTDERIAQCACGALSATCRGPAGGFADMDFPEP